jgi:putative hydrolase of the HAD superfamily
MSGAVLLDALGTLVELQPPAPRLQALLAAEGLEVSEEQAAGAFATEIAYYLEHHLEGADPEGVEDLRDRCASVMLAALELPGLDHATARRAMLAALRFEAYPEALGVLEALRAGGRRLVLVSNWDSSLPDWIAHTGVLEPMHAVVTSAGAGAAKPDPAIFRRALDLAGVEPREAVHVGDSCERDVQGARAAGIRPVLVCRAGEPPPGVESVRSLVELPSLL